MKFVMGWEISLGDHRPLLDGGELGAEAAEHLLAPLLQPLGQGCGLVQRHQQLSKLLKIRIIELYLLVGFLPWTSVFPVSWTIVVHVLSWC